MKKTYNEIKGNKRLYIACFPELAILEGKNTLTALLKCFPDNFNLSYSTLYKKLNEVELNENVKYKNGLFAKTTPFQLCLMVTALFWFFTFQNIANGKKN